MDCTEKGVRYHASVDGKTVHYEAHDSVLLARGFSRGVWEPHLLRIFRHFLRLNKSYLDLGAFIGTSVFYGAPLAKHCYAVEPNPLSCSFLRRNIELNPHLRGRVSIYEGCVMDHNGATTLRAGNSAYRSDASVLRQTSAVEWRVPCLTFADLLARLEVADLNFIKMDIEGAEAIVLPSMQDYLLANKITLFVSLHAFNFVQPKKELASIAEALSGYKYLYNREGHPLSLDALLSGQAMATHMDNNADVLATDIAWTS